MKLITLNIWGGKVYEPVMKFLKEKAEDTDIFCFQEMTFGGEAGFTKDAKARINLFTELQAILPDFTAYKNISKSEYFEYEQVNFGVGDAIFIKKSIKVLDHGGAYCFTEIPEGSGNGGQATGNYEWLDFIKDEEKFTVVNIHGVWQAGTGKMDTPARIIQSNVVKDFLSKKQGKKIICGDFNLMQDTESIKILENAVFSNLIKEYKISCTRTSFYEKPDKYADYIFTSKDIVVKDFKVLPEEVSDHSALFLDF